MARGMKVGTVSMWVLLLLSDRPMYGYEIIKALGRRFEGFWTPKTGTVYPALEKLEEAGLVRSKLEERRTGLDRRRYTLTEAGKGELLHLTSHWARMFELVEEYRETHKSLVKVASRSKRTKVSELLVRVASALKEGALDGKEFGIEGVKLKFADDLSLRVSVTKGEDGTELQFKIAPAGVHGEESSDDA
jgi:DNA-binding PadR family transcriptional regulator